ncbi:Smr domain-containing protein [Zymomonas mobilis subsp. mobilis ZM4 = ATCC 31821]|uniref:Smr protein/MutS2 n=2 Tax=Zymomonas mobilis TaxID=542 RepID=Q5NM02_ZYMMO|nr:Smr/MutS family protein [Zymomonas mobilis]AAV90258.1 Smr protein/MutS2 [Zymomonas mobilis subsp. mobilis ZM4 = ATCC 31821]AVZ26455.1 Smr domain-containing protein [Zymomonas mobilis subsp. mobilis]AVZ28341.1 Smr domain-containing protein [Zymomonas mobilis subsp. mobilis]AVZ42787.1 Smr domain-containing protein [Zymomonas mobilis subsp. mobilis ZM4 = ATCC 31821]MCP9308154.1 Smr/MutS family protein [Zymomonas mobilis]
MAKRKGRQKYPQEAERVTNPPNRQGKATSFAGRKSAPKYLSSEELALWQKVAVTVTPLEPERYQSLADLLNKNITPTAKAPPLSKLRKEIENRHRKIPPPPISPSPKKSSDTLDGSWDRKLSKGSVEPERSIDLHGYTMTSAYRVLESALSQAIRQGIRVLLIITGRPPRRNEHGIITRGLIRGAIGDWLNFSPYSSHIAAVRNAHPRHGGAGALYVILRRRRDETKY